jgi:hypothetical protein
VLRVDRRDAGGSLKLPRTYLHGETRESLDETSDLVETLLEWGAGEKGACGVGQDAIGVGSATRSTKKMRWLHSQRPAPCMRLQ